MKNTIPFSPATDKLKIGLTGGIGSGKSLVSDIFQQQYDITVIDADVLAREVVMPGQPALEKIAGHFGKDILQADGFLDRRKLRDIIFNAPAEKEWLEQLLHPLINQRAAAQLELVESPYAIFTSPLLLEGTQTRLVNRVLVIDAPEAMQIARASLRDGSTGEKIQRIMATQLSREERLVQADDIIHNHGTLTDLQQQVARLHEFYVSLVQEQF